MLPRQDIISALAGTYALLNATVITPEGAAVTDLAYGTAPVGRLLYTRQGYMSATITATEPEWRSMNLTFPSQPGQTDAEWAAVGRHMLCYSGPLSVSDAIPATNVSGQVIHGPLDVASVPAYVGTTQFRNYTVYHVDGEALLKISSPRPNGVANIWWKKLPSRL